MGKGLQFLNKKSWHTAGLPMVEQVWKKEQEKAAEEKRIAELQKQIQEERQVEELNRLAEAAGQGSNSVKRVEFLYDQGISRREEEEAYLLGKEWQPPKEEQEVHKQSLAKGDSTELTAKKAVVNNSANEIWAKLHNDPLMAIKRQEQAAIQRIKSNPVKMEAIKMQALMSLKAQRKQEKREKKEKKRERKEAKRLHKAETEKEADRSASPQPRRDDRTAAKRTRERSPSPARRRSRSRSREPGERRRDRDKREDGRDWGLDERRDNGDRRAGGRHARDSERYVDRDTDRDGNRDRDRDREAERRPRMYDRREPGREDKYVEKAPGDERRRQAETRTTTVMRDGASAQAEGTVYGLTFSSSLAQKVADKRKDAMATVKDVEYENAKKVELRPTDKYGRPLPMQKHRVGKLSEEEKQARLREMMGDAAAHDEDRFKRLKKAKEEQQREDEEFAARASEAERNGDHDKNFVEKMSNQIYGSAEGASIEERIKRRSYYSQRGPSGDAVSGSNASAFRR